jgi:hypothetical protein
VGRVSVGTGLPCFWRFFLLLVCVCVCLEKGKRDWLSCI